MNCLHCGLFIKPDEGKEYRVDESEITLHFNCIVPWVAKTYPDTGKETTQIFQLRREAILENLLETKKGH